MARKIHNPPLDNNHGTHATTAEPVGHDMGERTDVDHSNGHDGGETITNLPECDAGSGDIVTPERTGADIIADLLNVKVRLECERAKWEGIEADAKKAWSVLADELGKRAKGQHQTRVPVRIGGTVYDFKYTKSTATYSLIEAATPGEIK